MILSSNQKEMRHSQQQPTPRYLIQDRLNLSIANLIGNEFSTFHPFLYTTDNKKNNKKKNIVQDS